MSELSQIQEMLAVKDAQLKSMQTEANLLEVEVQKASERLNSISELIENYAVTVLLVEWWMHTQNQTVSLLSIFSNHDFSYATQVPKTLIWYKIPKWLNNCTKWQKVYHI